MHATSDFIEKLGIRFPIIQAPMAGVSTPELAACGLERRRAWFIGGWRQHY